MYLVYLYDVTYAYWKKWGLVILDWYYGEGMETTRADEKVKKKEWLSFLTFLSALLVSIPSQKYQSEMTNPLFSQYAYVTSSR